MKIYQQIKDAVAVGFFDAIPVVTSADFMAAGLQVGWIDLRRATMPDIWGQDMEVPDSILKSSGSDW